MQQQASAAASPVPAPTTAADSAATEPVFGLTSSGSLTSSSAALMAQLMLMRMHSASSASCPGADPLSGSLQVSTCPCSLQTIACDFDMCCRFNRHQVLILRAWSLLNGAAAVAGTFRHQPPRVTDLHHHHHHPVPPCRPNCLLARPPCTTWVRQAHAQ